MQTNTNSARLSIPPCPTAGTGVHGWIMATANRCRRARMSKEDAEELIAERMTRPASPPTEISSAIAKAYGTAGQGTPWNSFPHSQSTRPVPITAIKYDPEKLKAAAAKITVPKSWRHWLWERSFKRPETQNAWSFLAHVFSPGEQVQVFDKMESVKPFAKVEIGHPMDCRLPDLLRMGGRYGLGIWYLCNPVDGEWHLNPRTNTMSCRSEESISSFRYAVLESDAALADLWLALLVQLPSRVTAIYTSGGRSVHCLVRLDAPDKAAWDGQIQPIKRPAKVLGADPACLSAVRLTRLPQCWRPEKNGFQRLLYLNPEPPLVPLLDLPVRQTRQDTLARWRQVCPRWNRSMEADQ
jgi:hypothetical protein